MVEALSIVASAAMVISSSALVLLHVLPTGYNPIRDAVSDYAIGRYRAGFWLFVISGAVSGLALALARSDPWHAVKGLVDGWLPWVITGTAIATGAAIISPRLKRIFGLIKRSYYVSSIAWFLIVSIELARIGG